MFVRLTACDLQNSTFYRNSSKAYGGAVFGDGHHDNGVTYANNFASGLRQGILLACGRASCSEGEDQ